MMTTGTTDLAPVLDMLNACGFTRDKITRVPATHWYHRDAGSLRMTVAIRPRGTPAQPTPQVRVNIHDPARHMALVWAADFHAGTPAKVIIAALSAAMHDASGTQPGAGEATSEQVIATIRNLGDAGYTKVRDAIRYWEDADTVGPVEAAATARDQGRYIPTTPASGR